MRLGGVRLDEAGWYVWVLGVGDTERVRRFLLERLSLQRELGDTLRRPGQRRRQIKRALGIVSRSRALDDVRRLLGADQTLRAVQVITKLRAGLRAPELEKFDAEQREDTPRQAQGGHESRPAHRPAQEGGEA